MQLRSLYMLHLIETDVNMKIKEGQMLCVKRAK